MKNTVISIFIGSMIIVLGISLAWLIPYVKEMDVIRDQQMLRRSQYWEQMLRERGIEIIHDVWIDKNEAIIKKQIPTKSSFLHMIERLNVSIVYLPLDGNNIPQKSYNKYAMTYYIFSRDHKEMYWYLLWYFGDLEEK